MARQHNQIVIQMNRVRQFTSECIQRRVPNVVGMIDESGCSAGDLEIPFEQETSMLKTISAALLAVSVLAAPALAAQSGKTTANAAVIRTTQARQATTTRVKPAALNANAKMGKHHHRKHLSQHHRHHGKLGAMKTQSGAQARTSSQAALKTTTAPKVGLKPAAAISKRS